VSDDDGDQDRHVWLVEKAPGMAVVPEADY
jgi:hypothetical protein